MANLFWISIIENWKFRHNLEPGKNSALLLEIPLSLETLMDVLFKTPDARWRPQHFMGDRYIFIVTPDIFIGDNTFILETHIFVGEPYIFIGDYQIFIGDHQIFIGDPLFSLDNPIFSL